MYKRAGPESGSPRGRTVRQWVRNVQALGTLDRLVEIIGKEYRYG